MLKEASRQLVKGAGITATVQGIGQLPVCNKGTYGCTSWAMKCQVHSRGEVKDVVVGSSPTLRTVNEARRIHAQAYATAVELCPLQQYLFEEL